MIYRISWLPGYTYLLSTWPYAVLIGGFTVAILTFGFDLVHRIDMHIFNRARFLLFLLVILFFISTALYNPHEVFELNYFSRTLSLGVYVMLYGFLLPNFLIRNPTYFEKLVKFITNLGFVTSVFGLIVMGLGYFPSDQPGQLISYTRHPNAVSIILSVSILGTLYYLYWKGRVLNSLRKIFYGISVAFQIVAELLTQSRTGIIAVIISIFLFLALHYRRKIFFFVPFLLVIPFFLVRFLTGKGFASLFSRSTLWAAAISMATESAQTLLWGYGATRANDLFQKNPLLIYSFDIVAHPHNAYLSIILMFGLPFACLFLLLVLFLLFKGISRLAKSLTSSEKLFYNFLICLLVSFLVQGLFESPLVLSEYYLIQFFLLILGLLYISSYNHRSIRPMVNFN